MPVVCQMLPGRVVRARAGRSPHAPSARTVSRRDGARQSIQLVQINLDQSWSDPVSGEPAVGDVAAECPCRHVGVLGRRGEADQSALCAVDAARRSGPTGWEGNRPGVLRNPGIVPVWASRLIFVRASPRCCTFAARWRRAASRPTRRASSAPRRRDRLALHREAGLQRTRRAEPGTEHTGVERAVGEQVRHHLRPRTRQPQHGGAALPAGRTDHGAVHHVGRPEQLGDGGDGVRGDGIGLDVERWLAVRHRGSDLLRNGQCRVRWADRHDHVGAAGQLADVRHGDEIGDLGPLRRGIAASASAQITAPARAFSAEPMAAPIRPGCSTPTTGRAGISRTSASKQTGRPR